MNKIVSWLIKRNNKKVNKEWSDYCFLINLCLEGHVLNLDSGGSWSFRLKPTISA